MAVGFSSQLLEWLEPGRITAALVVLAIASFVGLARMPVYPRDLPRVGFGDGFLATIENWFDYVTRYNSWVSEGYEKVKHTEMAGSSCHHGAGSPSKD